MSEPRALTAKELAERLGVALSTVYKMSARGIIPSIPVGAKLTGRRFDEAAVRAALAAQAVSLRSYHPPRPVEAELVVVGEGRREPIQVA